MILSRTQFIEDTSEYALPVILVEAQGATYKLSRLNAGNDTVTLSLDASMVEPWGRKLYYWSFYGDGFIEATGYEETRDYDGFVKSRYGCADGPVLIAARGGNDEFVLLVAAPFHTDLEYTQFFGFGPSINAIDSAIPGYAASQRAVANKAKRDLLLDVNPINMLAEQEKQIDLLSLLVIDLAEKQPEGERPVWLPAFKNMLEQYSSTQFKGEDGSLADVVNRKAAMRELQRTYFAKREGMA